MRTPLIFAAALAVAPTAEPRAQWCDRYKTTIAAANSWESADGWCSAHGGTGCPGPHRQLILGPKMPA